jgi:cytochrome c-type biogenesis protein CcmH/NrfF
VAAGAALAAAAALATASVAGAAQPKVAPRASFTDVEAQLMCDTCNVPLAIADSPRADEERAEVRKLIARGLTKRQILDRLEAEWGPNILADPKGGGAAVTVWAVPAAVLVVVVVALALALPRWRRRRARPDDPGGPAEPAPLADADAERLERDLARYD